MRALGMAIAGAFIGFFLTGCATGYHGNSVSGGFSETQLGENAFRVTFRGNGYTKPERAADLSLLRAAEIALAHGFKYFVVVDAGQGSSLSTYTTPTQSYSTMNAYGYGGQAYGNATTTTTGGQTFFVSKPSATNTILCFKEKPETPGLVYDADFLVKSLKQKYAIRD